MILCLCTLDYDSSDINVTYLQLGGNLADTWLFTVFPKLFFCMEVFQSTVPFGLKISEMGCFSSEANILHLHPGIRLKVSLAAKFPLFLTCTSPPSSKELLGFQLCSSAWSWNWCFTWMLRCGLEVQDRSERARIMWMGTTRKMGKGNRIRMWRKEAVVISGVYSPPEARTDLIVPAEELAGSVSIKQQNFSILGFCFLKKTLITLKS